MRGPSCHCFPLDLVAAREPSCHDTARDAENRLCGPRTVDSGLEDSSRALRAANHVCSAPCGEDKPLAQHLRLPGECDVFGHF